MSLTRMEEKISREKSKTCIDMSLTRMEERSAERKARLVNLRENEIKRRNEDQFCILECSNSSDEDNDTDDFTSHVHVVNTRPRNTMDFGVASTLDRTRVSDRNATFIIELPQRAWAIKLGT